MHSSHLYLHNLETIGERMSNASKLPFIGITRFSVVSPTGMSLKLSNQYKSDGEEYIRRLFDRERLEQRFDVLERVALPIYQSYLLSYNYSHIIQYSREMPEWGKKRLRKIADDYSVVRLSLVSDESIVDSVLCEVRSWGNGFRGEFVWFRVDDDDILSADYLDVLSQYALPTNVGMAVSFSKLAVAIWAGGLLFDYRVMDFPNNSVGQAYICRANVALDSFETPPVLPHTQVHRSVPTIVDGTAIHGVQVRHALQDTAVGASRMGARLSHLHNEMSKLEVLNLSEVVDRFPSLERKPDDLGTESMTVELNVGAWVDISDVGGRLNDGSIVLLSYVIEFAGTPDNGSSVSIEFNQSDLTAGHYPRDDARGDYRRLYVDKNGSGQIAIVIPGGSSIRRLRLNADGGARQATSALIRITQLGSSDELAIER